MQERGGDVHPVLDPERPAGGHLGAQLVSGDDVGGRALKGGNLTEDLVHTSISESRDGAQPDAGRVMRNELPGNGGGWANSSAARPGSSVRAQAARSEGGCTETPSSRYRQFTGRPRSLDGDLFTRSAQATAAGPNFQLGTPRHDRAGRNASLKRDGCVDDAVRPYDCARRGDRIAPDQRAVADDGAELRRGGVDARAVGRSDSAVARSDSAQYRYDLAENLRLIAGNRGVRGIVRHQPDVVC